MAKLSNYLNFEEASKRISVSGLPEGQYVFRVMDSNLKRNKYNEGYHLMMHFSVIGSGYSGREHWACLNIGNLNKNVAYNSLLDYKKVCLACGFSGLVNETNELNGKCFKGYVEVKDQKARINYNKLERVDIEVKRHSSKDEFDW